jgi:DNA-binding response OmpR family regulator
MARILVAEDNAMLLGAIQDTLELSGYDVCAVRNGVQAMEALSHFRPEVIVSDLAMPEMDGFELYRQVRRESSDTAIPFVFISARYDAQAVAEVVGNNGPFFLRKPFGSEELLEAVGKLLKKHEPTPASPADLSPAQMGAAEKGIHLREAGALVTASC